MGKIANYVKVSKQHKIAKWTSIAAIAISVGAAIISGLTLYMDTRVNPGVDTIENPNTNLLESTLPDGYMEVINLIEAGDMATLILRNNSKRDIGISALMFKDGDQKSYATMASPDQSGTIEIKAGGSIILNIFLCSWVITITEHGQTAESVKSYFVTGFGDREIDLPSQIMRSLEQGSKKYISEGRSYKSRCIDAIGALTGMNPAPS